MRPGAGCSPIRSFSEWQGCAAGRYPTEYAGSLGTTGTNQKPFIEYSMLDAGCWMLDVVPRALDLFLRTDKFPA